MRHFVFPGLAVVAATAFGTWATALAPVVNPPVRVAGLEAQDSHAAASLLGQFRSSWASWMYLRTDLYLHNGVEMRPLTEGEARAGRKAEESSEKGDEKLHEESIVSVVPPRERDFRGVFGDLERATAAYQDMHGHEHNDPKKALPLFRLMTWVDPQFITGWTIGSSIIAMDRSERGTTEALRFLQEGLKANPQSVDLLHGIGTTLISRGRRIPEAVPYLERARQTGLKHLKMLSEGEVEALDQTYRWLALSYRELGHPGRMRAVAREGLQVFPDDKVLARILGAASPAAGETARKDWPPAKAQGDAHEDHDHDHDGHQDHAHGDHH